MATKPTQDPKWVASDDPAQIIEPSAAFKNNGILSGGVWSRENLNWMFNAISKWIDWVRSYALDKDNNLSDLDNKATAFTNIKQAATTTSTGVVELATDTEVQTGTDTSRAVTPKGLASRTATETRTGVVEKATSTEMSNGTADKFPDASTVKTWVDGNFVSGQAGTGTSNFRNNAQNDARFIQSSSISITSESKELDGELAGKGSLRFSRVGHQVTISASSTDFSGTNTDTDWSTDFGYIPVAYRPLVNIRNSYTLGAFMYTMSVTTDGRVIYTSYRTTDGTTVALAASAFVNNSISYNIASAT